MKELISVIVPIYNLEQYIEKCIKSIINQTYKNLEIILVDDGSSDRSLEICEVYAKLDGRIKVLHQPNKGVTSARKLGASNATGKYIGFVDGDDWIEDNMYQVLYQKMKEESAHIVASGVYRDDDNGAYAKWSSSDFKPGTYRTVDKLNYIHENLFKDGRYIFSAGFVNKLFVTDLLKEQIMKLDDRLVYGEDTACVLPCLLEANTIVVLDEAYYHAYERGNSATHTRRTDMLMQNNLVYNHLMEYVQGHYLVDKLQYEIKKYYLHIVNVELRELSQGIIPAYFWEDSDNDYKKVIIYGAGKVGKSYYQQFKAEQRYDVVLWVDKNSEKINNTWQTISPIKAINNVKYDAIIVAMIDEKNACEVKNDLQKLGISAEKIKWNTPKTIYDYYGK